MSGCGRARRTSSLRCPYLTAACVGTPGVPSPRLASGSGRRRRAEACRRPTHAAGFPPSSGVRAAPPPGGGGRRPLPDWAALEGRRTSVVTSADDAGGQEGDPRDRGQAPTRRQAGMSKRLRRRGFVALAKADAERRMLNVAHASPSAARSLRQRGRQPAWGPRGPSPKLAGRMPPACRPPVRLARFSPAGGRGGTCTDGLSRSARARRRRRLAACQPHPFSSMGRCPSQNAGRRPRRRPGRLDGGGQVTRITSNRISERRRASGFGRSPPRKGETRWHTGAGLVGCRWGPRVLADRSAAARRRPTRRASRNVECRTLNAEC